MRTRPAAGLAGAAAVGLALALAEVAAAAIDGVPSLVTTVGSYVVPFVPPAVEDAVIGLFGTSDKAVLAAGTVTLSLLIGAAAGIAGITNRSNATALFAMFGMLGVLAAVARPLTTPVTTIVVTVLATVAGRTALGFLLTRLQPSASVHSPDPAYGDRTLAGGVVGRRGFVTGLVGVAAASVVMATIARNLMRPPPVDIDEVVLPTPQRRLPDVPPGADFDVEGLTPIHVGNDDFYRIDTALSVPRIDPAEWSLRIHGMVAREVELSYQDLLDMPLVEHDATIACVSNEVGGRLVGNARWLGVPLPDVLDLAGVHDGATQVVGRAIDGWTAGFPTTIALDGREALVVVGMNGAALPAAHGFPVRLIIPGLYGYVSATKWLTEIELTTWEGFDAYWVPRGWAKEGPVKTQSRIDVPRPGSQVQLGTNVVAGVAWAPTRGIAEVEIRVDGGDWRTCELSEPLDDDAWVQWRTEVNFGPGRHRIQVRATDGTGATQPQNPVPPRPDGAEGWHETVVTV